MSSETWKNIEFDLTYECFAVYEWSIYPPSSVLAGQNCKRFLDSYDTIEEARAANPGATENGYIDPGNSYDHLPDDEEYDHLRDDEDPC